MNKGRYKAPQDSDSEFVDEILEEARKMRGDATDSLDDQDIPLAQARPVGNLYERPKRPVESPQPKRPVVNPPAPETIPSTVSPEIPQQPTPQPNTDVVGQHNENKKKKFFGKNRKSKVTVGEDDIYFGLKLRTVEEVKAQRRQELNQEGYSGGPLKVSSPTSTFAHLFEEHEPDTSPEFEEKFRQLHLERQERVKQAVKEAGTEVEDVFCVYEEPDQLHPTVDEQVQKKKTEKISDQKANSHIDLEQLYEEDLKAQQQSDELRQLIDDVLAKETVVEVDPPLHTESLFGRVAKERTQDTVDAEITQGTVKPSVGEFDASDTKISEQEDTHTLVEKNVEHAEEKPKTEHKPKAYDSSIQESVDTKVPTQSDDDRSISIKLSEDSSLQVNEEKVYKEQQADTSVSKSDEKSAEHLKIEHKLAVDEQIEDILLISKPVQYQFHTKPLRTCAIAGVGDILAQEVKHFQDWFNPQLSTTQESVQVKEEKQMPEVHEEKQIDSSVGEIAKTHMAPSVEQSDEVKDAPTLSGEQTAEAEHIVTEKQTAPQLAFEKERYGNVVRLADMKKEQGQIAPDLQGTGKAPIEASAKKKNIRDKNRIKLLTDIEEEDDDIPDVMEEQPELEDFHSKEDIRSIVGDLRKDIQILLLRSAVTSICTAVLLILGFLAEFRIFGIHVSALAYAVTSLVFLLIAIGSCATTIFNGIRSLVRLRASADSSIAIASVVVAIQSIVILFMPQALESGNIHIYSSLITGGLLLNALGKLTMVRRVRQNFKFVASNGEKNTVELVENAEIAAQMAKDCVAGVPVVAYQKKSKFFSNYLKNSYAKDCSELTSQVIAPLSFISSLVLFIVSMIISQNVGVGFTAFAASMCICVPMANMLCVHLPVSRLCKLARKNGGMLVSYEAVDKFADTNAIMIEADDLFPKGTVELKGIKTFGKQSFDRILLEAVSLMSQVGGPLNEVFLQVVRNRDDILPHVENIIYEDECGAIGWVAGRRILVGNRDLMDSYNIDVPSVQIRHDEGYQLVYLAADQEVVCIFTLAYYVNPTKKQEIQRMVKNGIGMVVKTTDPSITAEFISKQFGIDIHFITVLCGSLVHTYNELSGHQEETSNAMFATKGKATCMMRVITACVREKSNISTIRLLQNISVILGFILVAFLICFSALNQISTLAMVVYQVFWIVVLLALPKIRRL